MEFVIKTRGQKAEAKAEAVAEVEPKKTSKAKKVAVPQFLEANPQPMEKTKSKSEAVADFSFFANPQPIKKSKSKAKPEAVAEAVADFSFFQPMEKAKAKSKAKPEAVAEAVADFSFFQPMEKSKAVAEAVADFPSSADFPSLAQDSSSDYGSISSDEQQKDKSAPKVSRCDSGSASFGPKTQKAGEVDPYRIFMTEFEYDNKSYKITIPAKVDMSVFLDKANDMSPLLIDHLAKGGIGTEIITRKNKGTAKAKTARVRAVNAPKLVKQMKKDLEEEGGEVLYTWMFIAEKKNSNYHYYLLSNKVKSRLEFGTKHFMLENKYKEKNRNKAPDRIYLTGEFRVRPGILEYNFMSGTYMSSKMNKLESIQTDVKPIEERFTKALGEHFSKMQVVRLPDCQPFIPQPSKNKVLTEKEWNYVQDLFGQYTIEQTKQQEEMAKRDLERMNRINAILNNLGKKK